MNASFVKQSVIKQKAKEIQKQKHISWHQALDEASVFYGFANYKNYLNCAKAERVKQIIAQEKIYYDLSADKQNKITKKLGQLSKAIKSFKLPMKDLVVTLEKSQESKEVMRSICEKAHLKEYIDLHLLKSSLQGELEEIEMNLEYLMTKSVSVKNLRHKLVNGRLSVEGDYDIIYEFAFDGKVEGDDPFKDRTSSGLFEISIDKKGHLTINYLDGGLL